MGNLWAESNICSIRLQGDFSSGYATSVDYTKKVDNGTISKSAFVNNGPNGGGYGLAQWTYYTRKQALYEYAKSKNASIGDLQMQLEFLMMELSSSYPSVLAVLRTSNDVGACAEVVLLKFERPANMHSKIGDRTGFARKYL